VLSDSFGALGANATTVPSSPVRSQCTKPVNSLSPTSCQPTWVVCNHHHHSASARAYDFTVFGELETRRYSRYSLAASIERPSPPMTVQVAAPLGSRTC
jgi:hypothetical protein